MAVSSLALASEYIATCSVLPRCPRTPAGLCYNFLVIDLSNTWPHLQTLGFSMISNPLNLFLAVSEDMCSDTFINEISEGLLLERCYVLTLGRSLEQIVGNFLVDLVNQRHSLKGVLTGYENG